jgi:hypothetical protein
LPLSRGHRTRKSNTYRDGAAVVVGCSGRVRQLPAG